MRVMQNIRTTSCRALACSAMAFSVFSMEAAAAEKTTELQHSVYVGGLFLGNINTEIEQDRGRYRIESTAVTSKTFDWAFRWMARGTSIGSMNADKFAPVVHSHESAWNGNTRSAVMNYSDAGTVKVETTATKTADPNKFTPIDPDSLTNSMDPMSAILLITNRLEAGQGCNAEVPVFDGRRRYDVKLTEKAEKSFNPSPYSVFKGKAIGCKIEVVKKGGFKKEPDNFNRIDQELVIWAAAPYEGARIVPVRMQVDTDFGRMELHLEKYSDGPVKLVSKNAS